MGQTATGGSILLPGELTKLPEVNMRGFLLCTLSALLLAFSTAESSIDGFTKFPGRYIWGGDLSAPTRMTVEECAEWCKTTDMCVGFDYQGDTGYWANSCIVKHRNGNSHPDYLRAPHPSLKMDHYAWNDSPHTPF